MEAVRRPEIALASRTPVSGSRQSSLMHRMPSSRLQWTPFAPLDCTSCPCRKRPAAWGRKPPGCGRGAGCHRCCRRRRGPRTGDAFPGRRGSGRAASSWPPAPLEHVLRAVVRDGALVNAASTEEGTGSPSRGGLPDTRAVRAGDFYLLSGEKTYTTWLPVLKFAVVSARLEDQNRVDSRATPRVGLLLVDLDAPGVERLPGFDALGMRGSASGTVRFTDVAVPAEMLIVARDAGQPDPRGPSPQGWFAACLAATYLGVGEGARTAVVRWAVDRRPGDGSTSVADIPSVQLRLGRLDAAMRIARTVLVDAARRWDAARPDERPGAHVRDPPRQGLRHERRRRRHRRGPPDRRRARLPGRDPSSAPSATHGPASSIRPSTTSPTRALHAP